MSDAPPPRVPPTVESNYPRDQYATLGVARPPGVYFDSIGVAFEMLKAGWGVYAVCTLMTFAIIGGLYFAVFVVAMQVMPNMQNSNPFDPGSFKSQLSPALIVAQCVALVLASLPILGLISVGVNHAMGQWPSIGDFFSPLRNFRSVIVASIPLCIPLLLNYLFALIVGSASSSFGSLLPMLAIGVVLILFGILAQGTIYMAMTAAGVGGYGPIIAYKETLRRMGWQSLMMSLLVFVATIVGSLGLIACCIGVLFTYPIFTNVIALHYLYFFPPVRTVAGQVPVPQYRPR